jgi:hypothetical protein
VYEAGADHITLSLDNNMSTAAVFLDIDEVFDTKWHSGLVYKLSELEFSTGVIKFIASFLTDRKFKVLVVGEFCTPRKIAAGVPQGSVVASVLYGLYTVNWCPRLPGTLLGPFADDTSIYATEKHERRVLCKLQRGFNSRKFVV